MLVLIYCHMNTARTVFYQISLYVSKNNHRTSCLSSCNWQRNIMVALTSTIDQKTKHVASCCLSFHFSLQKECCCDDWKRGLVLFRIPLHHDRSKNRFRLTNLVASKHDAKRSGNMLLAVPSVLIPPQHPSRPAASGCRSGQRRGSFLEAAVNPGSISGGYPPSRLRQRLRLAAAAATNRTMSPTPAAAPSGDEEFTEVVVVRHGETSWNASRIVQVVRPFWFFVILLLNFAVCCFPNKRKAIDGSQANMIGCREFSHPSNVNAFIYAGLICHPSRQSKYTHKVSIFNYIAQCLSCHICI